MRGDSILLATGYKVCTAIKTWNDGTWNDGIGHVHRNARKKKRPMVPNTYCDK